MLGRHRHGTAAPRGLPISIIRPPCLVDVRARRHARRTVAAVKRRRGVSPLRGSGEKAIPTAVCFHAWRPFFTMHAFSGNGQCGMDAIPAIQPSPEPSPGGRGDQIHLRGKRRRINSAVSQSHAARCSGVLMIIGSKLRR